MWIKILAVAVILVAGVLIYAATRPSHNVIKREAFIKAPPEKVFEYVNEMPKFELWNPWAKMDPAMKKSFSGPAAGVGASQTWDGNMQVGAGEMTVAETVPGRSVHMKLKYKRPFDCESDAFFTLRPENGGTVITWSVEGESGFPQKLIGIFMNMDKMVGTVFEGGLNDLKTQAEGA